MLSLKRKKQINNSVDFPKVVDAVEADVFSLLERFGFKRYGRTLHRFVSNDISQVINFQTGMPYQEKSGLMCVNIGIRVPECVMRDINFKNDKKYYKEYECNIRSRLGAIKGKQEAWYDLSRDPKRIASDITKEITDRVLPVFDVLSSREAILQYRKDYPLFDELFSHLRQLEDSFIYRYIGNEEMAEKSFDEYYRTCVEEYENKQKEGRKVYLKKGERVVYMGQDITAEKDGYIALYGASHAHIDYLDELKNNWSAQGIIKSE